MTLHSFFQLPMGLHLPDMSRENNNQRRFSRDKIQLLRTLDLLVIDEISMVRADLLDAVDDVLRRYRGDSRAFGGVQLLILDDWGLEPLDAAARHDLLEILEERYGRRSTIITSQIPVDRWHELIGDPTYADAILDRLVHNAHRINLTGHSLRRSRATKASKD